MLRRVYFKIQSNAWCRMSTTLTAAESARWADNRTAHLERAYIAGTPLRFCPFSISIFSPPHPNRKQTRFLLDRHRTGREGRTETQL